MQFKQARVPLAGRDQATQKTYVAAFPDPPSIP